MPSSFAQTNFPIPQNAEGVVVERTLTAQQWFRTPSLLADGDAYIMAVVGHMHNLGRQFSFELENAEGKKTLLDIPDWDFHWQGTYFLKEPVKVVPTDKITIRCLGGRAFTVATARVSVFDSR